MLNLFTLKVGDILQYASVVRIGAIDYFEVIELPELKVQFLFTTAKTVIPFGRTIHIGHIKNLSTHNWVSRCENISRRLSSAP